MREKFQRHEPLIREVQAVRSNGESDCTTAECTIQALVASWLTVLEYVDQFWQKVDESGEKITCVCEDSSRTVEDFFFIVWWSSRASRCQCFKAVKCSWFFDDVWCPAWATLLKIARQAFAVWLVAFVLSFSFCRWNCSLCKQWSHYSSARLTNETSSVVGQLVVRLMVCFGIISYVGTRGTVFEARR